MNINIGFLTLCCLLIASYTADGYVLLTANAEDFKGIVKKLVPESIIEHLADVITKKISNYDEMRKLNDNDQKKPGLGDMFKDLMRAMHLDDTAKKQVPQDDAKPVVPQKQQPVLLASVRSRPKPLALQKQNASAERVVPNYQQSIYRPTTKNKSIYMQKANKESNVRRNVKLQTTTQKNENNIKRNIISPKIKNGDEINIDEIVKIIKERLEQKYANSQLDDSKLKQTNKQPAEYDRSFETQHNIKTAADKTENMYYNTDNRSKLIPMYLVTSRTAAQDFNKNTEVKGGTTKSNIIETNYSTTYDGILISDTAAQQTTRTFEKLPFVNHDFHRDDIEHSLEPIKGKIKLSQDDPAQVSNYQTTKDHSNEHEPSVDTDKRPRYKQVHIEFELPVKTKEPVKQNNNVPQEEDAHIKTSNGDYEIIQLNKNNNDYDEYPQESPGGVNVESAEEAQKDSEKVFEHEAETFGVQAKTESLWYDEKQAPEIEPIQPSIYLNNQQNRGKKNKFNQEYTTAVTHMPTRARFTVEMPDYVKNIPIVAEKYDFNEPLPERDREPERLPYVTDPYARINKKYKLHP